MLHELQGVLKHKTKLNGEINVTAVTIETTIIPCGHLIPNLSGVKVIAGNLGFPHILIDSEGYKLRDNKGYILLSAEPERSET